MHCKSKKIMKENKCFACDKKTKQKRRFRQLETLCRVRRDNGLAAFIDPMKMMRVYQISDYTVLPSS